MRMKEATVIHVCAYIVRKLRHEQGKEYVGES